MTAPSAEIAVIGGSGFYSYLGHPVEVRPTTPWGEPSGPITVGEVGGRQVAFLPRHGPTHSLPPHRINHRANLWALRDLGVRRVIGPCAVGSLQTSVQAGDFVVLDQLVDRTWGRADTYLDGPVPAGSRGGAGAVPAGSPPGGGSVPAGSPPGGGSAVEHVSFADPYCPELSAVLVSAGAGGDGSAGSAAGDELTIHPKGTVVVIQGPRFSTRAESRWFQSLGWDVVNMTQYPEAYLARELGLCYCGLALVTDTDAGVDPGGAVTMEAVMAVLASNVDRTRRLLGAAIPLIPPQPSCPCAAGGAASLRPPDAG